MARVVVAQPARDDLEALIRSGGLPDSARDRVRLALGRLTLLPLLGPALRGRWSGFRFILGPWPWMLVIYACDPSTELVIVVAVEDSRTGRSPRSGV